jgi:hypothetical protein
MRDPIPPIPTGIDLRKAFEIAKILGCQLEHLRRTGETRVSHSQMSTSCRVDSRRKDSPRHLVVWLRSLASARAQTADRPGPAWPDSGQRVERGSRTPYFHGRKKGRWK